MRGHSIYSKEKHTPWHIDSQIKKIRKKHDIHDMPDGWLK